jgi:hypothetical protein
MAKELQIDIHDITKKFLWQYANSDRFKLFVNSFIHTAFDQIETQLDNLYRQTSLMNSNGATLDSWGNRFGVPRNSTDDELYRDEILKKISEIYSLGTVYDVQDFFKNYYRAADVHILEKGNGQIDLTVLGGIQKYPPRTSILRVIFDGTPNAALITQEWHGLNVGDVIRVFNNDQVVPDIGGQYKVTQIYPQALYITIPGNTFSGVIDTPNSHYESEIDWPCFVAGMAQLDDIKYQLYDYVFSFAEDQRPLSAGYGILEADGTTVRAGVGGYFTLEI